MRFVWATGLAAVAFAPLGCAEGEQFGGGGEGGDGYGAYGGGGAGGVGGGGAGGLPGCDYTAPNTCPAAEALPSIAGDENGATITKTGSTSKWFKIHITEENGSVLSEDLSYTVTLSSPFGMNYDLFVHQGPQDGNPDCNAAPLSSTNTSGTDVVSNDWNDDQGFGGEDDSLWLNIEVRYVSGMDCGPGSEWSLTIKGHT